MSLEEQNVVTLVILLDAGLHTASRGGRGGVHVGDKAEGGFLAGELCVDITMLPVVVGFQSHFTELFIQKRCQVVLLGGRRLCAGLFCGLRVNLYIS